MTELLRNVKAVFSIITKAPQTLFDGISQHYATGIYPQIYEIENLMRKLITKFMLINVLNLFLFLFLFLILILLSLFNIVDVYKCFRKIKSKTELI